MSLRHAGEARRAPAVDERTCVMRDDGVRAQAPQRAREAPRRERRRSRRLAERIEAARQGFEPRPCANQIASVALQD